MKFSIIIPVYNVEMAKHCKEKGLAFGLWFEPEAISEDSDLYRKHPEYALGERGKLCSHR